MHEMSLAENVLQIITDAAMEQNFSSVKTVRLEIGQLAGVEADAMKFCFTAVTRDTIAQDAKLEIIETPGQAHCTYCAMTVHVRTVYDACPQCGMLPLQVTGGNEMRVKELDVE